MRLSALVWGYNLPTPRWGLYLARSIGLLSETSEVGAELPLTRHGGARWKQRCGDAFFTNCMQPEETHMRDAMEVGRAHVHPPLLNCYVKGKSWLRYTVILHKTQCKAASVLRGRYRCTSCVHIQGRWMSIQMMKTWMFWLAPDWDEQQDEVDKSELLCYLQ